MGLDIRWPIGLMFTLIGALLTGYGAITSSNAEMYKRSLDININVYWGVVLLVFGGGFGYIGHRQWGAGQSDRRTHRLQRRLRAAHGHRALHRHGRRAFGRGGAASAIAFD